ncbi:MAG: hypothetical protein DI536_02025 [Archangium gephyra]|uniref:Lipoprotein n=1 Tax=Archangium gephyra TaxID=48 RepID=A0A2W5TW63_9BACT|nr:MAG: hypothetical protein DI536_02025 [Archangium gephyra]
MKQILLGVVLSLGFVGCGSPEGGGTGGGGGSQTCTQAHTCRNGSCTCDDGPNKDNSCCSPSDSSCTTNKCDTYCRYCR